MIDYCSHYQLTFGFCRISHMYMSSGVENHVILCTQSTIITVV